MGKNFRNWYRGKVGGEAHSSKQNFTFQSDLQTNDTFSRHLNDQNSSCKVMKIVLKHGLSERGLDRHLSVFIWGPLLVHFLVDRILRVQDVIYPGG